MRLLTFLKDNQPTVGISHEDGVIDLSIAALDLPQDMLTLLRGEEHSMKELKKVARNPRPHAIHSAENITYLPPITNPSKIICVGLNYAKHIEEGRFAKQENPFPVLFTRFASTLVPHNGTLIKPHCSDKFDYEGELVAVIGKKARHVKKANALDYVMGYSIFNDATVRDYQSRTHQWTLGKNFDASGGFGSAIVTADDLPAGGKGLRLTTKVNGKTLQDADTGNMIFDVADIIENITEVMELNAGDIIVTGTPESVGFARTPPIYLKDGDVCDITIEGIGTLTNHVKSEAA